MTVQEKAEAHARSVWGDSLDATEDQIINAYIAGHNEAKPKEVMQCPHCGSKSLKWAFRFVKKCNDCNEVFPCEL